MAGVSMDKPRQDLARAKATVLADVAGAQGLTPPTVTSPSPIAALPAEVTATIQARVQDGLAPLGRNSPSAGMMKRIVVPSAVLALLDAVLLVVALVAGSSVLAIVAAVLFVLLAGAAFGGYRAAAKDPLRLTARDRVAIAAAGRWHSSQPWTGPIARTQECALVVAAARAAQRIVASRPWTSGELAARGVTVAIGPELDDLDAAAYRLATQRYADFPGGLPGAPLSSPELDATWDRTVTRAAALTAYADTLDGLADRERAALSRQVPGVGDVDAEADEFAGLAFFLSGAIYDV